MVALPWHKTSPQEDDRSVGAAQTTRTLLGLLVVVSILSLGTGAAGLSVFDAARDLVSGEGLSVRDRVILMDIRLPRLAMGLMIGAALALSGALMQGLFRNPLADPGIVGVGAGAGLGAVLAIVLAGLLPTGLAVLIGAHLVPVAAFLGGWASTLLLYRVATRGGQTSVATMLLAGIALGALAGALTGMLVYMADDRQLRDLTFWNMGSLAGASWSKLAASLPLILPVLLLSPLLARGLNALALGEAQAAHLGIHVETVKRLAILGVAAAAGAAVAVAGGIGFVGIVVPHLLRLATGPDHRYLLPNAALLGASLLVGADMVARVIVSPAELPIGIVTATMGAPVFLWILLKRRGLGGL
ncbi:MAG: FecCD family ABC transporter permease [Paracoccaceae bacterium]|uniref:FecCD family ABC transporter permease n=1 Tax=Seohaeicola saemankumensis TaxID=481181 RepID=UPI001E575210|nr:iron ABC transporter permease [Seohaeicola saemankumensis]MCD1627587.1 iron ABC transporter permease [Seohaeicola saemankumensis]